MRKVDEAMQEAIAAVMEAGKAAAKVRRYGNEDDLRTLYSFFDSWLKITAVERELVAKRFHERGEAQAVRELIRDVSALSVRGSDADAVEPFTDEDAE